MKPIWAEILVRLRGRAFVFSAFIPGKRSHPVIAHPLGKAQSRRADARAGRGWIAAALFVCCTFGQPQSQRRIATSPLAFSTTDPQLQQSFDWAKQQALAYVSTGKDAVGDWYESALPGRNAFCMRDVSHQVMGAQALGLGDKTRTCCLTSHERSRRQGIGRDIGRSTGMGNPRQLIM